MPTEETRVAVVTGANRGIGYAIAKNLAAKFDGGLVYVTARSEQAARDAVARLKSAGLANCRPHQLDISDAQSIAALKAFLRSEHGGLDVLVNNAGVICSPDSHLPPREQLKNTVHVNYFGTLNVSNRKQVKQTQANELFFSLIIGR
jgi:NAD(P)-dependent dehydrogenase (short-subunit alcohol dehydrogenase family)